MAFNCIIIGNNPEGFQELENYLSEIPSVYLIGRYATLEDADIWLKRGVVDVLMMGIQDNDPVLEMGPPLLPVFIMVYTNEYTEPVDFRAIAPLTLPFSLATLKKTFSEINSIYDMEGIESPSPSVADFFNISATGRLEKVFYNDLQYIEVMDDNIMLHLGEQKLVTEETLDIIEAKLPARIFMRVHRWFVINLLHITTIGEDYVQIGVAKIRLTTAMKNELVKRYSLLQ